MIAGAKILLIEDDAAIATVVRVALEGEGASVRHVATVAERDAVLSGQSFDAIVTDVMLPDGNGLDGWDGARAHMIADTPLIVLSAQNTLDTAIHAEAKGAFDYLPKPFDLDELVAALRAALARGNERELGANTPEDSLTVGDSLSIIGRDPAMQLVYRTLARVAPTDLSVLILGESGTGKELIAQAIHASSPRNGAPFVAVNMAAIPRELIESELFGHEKGAFTGAHAKSTGRFEQAASGTLFLDEIGDMPLEAQTRLLRVLQSGEYSPIGSARVRRANVRILAATNQDLTALVASGRFREDLYYRLNVIPLNLPPLRHRRSDIAMLARHFLEQGGEMGLPVLDISADALKALAHHDWPGNVRELQNVMQRLALLTRAHRIEAADVQRLFESEGGPRTMAAGGAAIGDGSTSARSALISAVRQWMDSAEAYDAADERRLHPELMTIVEQEAIEVMLDRHDGNQLRAAQILGINRNTLRLKRRRPVSDG